MHLFMPIGVWVIEHPEGIIVIDTGDTEDAAHNEFHNHKYCFSGSSV